MPTKKNASVETMQDSLDSLLQRVTILQEMASKIFPNLVAPAVVINPEPPILYARDMHFAQTFRRKGLTGIYMRARPVSFLLNSTLVSECLSTGKVLIVDMEKGSCFFIKGDEEIVLISGENNAKQSQ